ncbi:MAG: substrate-binding domain-containing protein [Caldilineales bacterium]
MSRSFGPRRHLAARAAGTGWQSNSQITRACLLLVLLLAGCGTVMPTQEPLRLTLAASASAVPLAHDLADALHGTTPNLVVDVLELANEMAAQHAVTSGQADGALVAGEVDIPTSLLAYHIADDALAVAVHPQRDLASISQAQLHDLLGGQLRAWSDLNAGDGDIQVYVREPDSGARRLIVGLLLTPRPLTPTAIVLPDDARLRDSVAADPNAIALLPAAWLNDAVRPVPIEGRGPEWVRQGWPDYPARLPISLLVPREPSSTMGLFSQFVASEAGRQAISQHYAAVEVQP